MNYRLTPGACGYIAALVMTAARRRELLRRSSSDAR